MVWIVVAILLARFGVWRRNFLASRGASSGGAAALARFALEIRRIGDIYDRMHALSTDGGRLAFVAE
jgi:hypothetical protein